ncbi:MAG: hypothetical protein OXM61_20770 [Candidatus Poribacteria bacterium]|nr:hypothetical protein [Candidatus Poribacteria bacterium]
MKKEKRYYSERWWQRNKHLVDIQNKDKIEKKPDVYAMKFKRFYRNLKIVWDKFNTEYKLGSDRRIELHRSHSPACPHLFNCDTLNVYLSVFERLCGPEEDFYYRRLWDTLKISGDKNISDKIDELDRKSLYLKQPYPRFNLLSKSMREFIKFHKAVYHIVNLIYEKLQEDNVFYYNESRIKKCMFCLKTNKDVEFTAEHIIPSSLLGDHTLTLVIPPGTVCHTCNNKLSAFDKTFTEFLPCQYLKLIFNPYIESSKKLRLPNVEFKNVILKKWGIGGLIEILTKENIKFDLDKDIILKSEIGSLMGGGRYFFDIKEIEKMKDKTFIDYVTQSDPFVDPFDNISWQITEDFNSMKIGTDFRDDRKYIMVYPLKNFNAKSRLRLQKFLLAKCLEHISVFDRKAVYLQVFDVVRDFVLYGKNLNDFVFYTIPQRFYDGNVDMNNFWCVFYDHNDNEISLQDIENLEKSNSPNIDKIKFEFFYDFYGQLFFVGYGLDPLHHSDPGVTPLCWSI